MRVHEVNLLVQGRVVRSQRATGELGRRVLEGILEGLDLGLEEDEARVVGLWERADNGDGVAGFEDLDVRGGVHVRVNVHDPIR